MKFHVNLLFFLGFILLSCRSTDGGMSAAGGMDAAEAETVQADYRKMLYDGQEEQFLAALASGQMNVDWTDEDGAGFLHHAVWLGREDTVRTLIEMGAGVNAQRNDGYTPMHLAAYNGNLTLLELLAGSGGAVDALGSGTTPLYWAAARERRDAALYLISQGADGLLSGEKMPSPLECFQEKLDMDFGKLYETYGTSVIAAVLENPETLESGTPELPPFPSATLGFSGSVDYLGKSLINVAVTNSGKGDLFKLTAEVLVGEAGSKRKRSVYFGRIPAGGQARRTLAFDDFSYLDSGRSVPVTVGFKESNGYVPEDLQGMISVLKPDAAFLIRHIADLNTATIKTFLDREFFTVNDLSRAALIRANDLGMGKIQALLEDELIDRNVIDKLLRYNRIPYTIDDLVYFAGKKVISQENLELVLLEKRIPYDADDVMRIASENYISSQVVEALYRSGLKFTQDQIQQLAKIGIFSLPEALYTYTISDGDSSSSAGNKDGMIQVGEGVDFSLIVKNNSIFVLDNLQITLMADEQGIDIFNNTTQIPSLHGGETVSLNATIGVKRAFEGEALRLRLDVKDKSFGSLIAEELDVPVGRTVGSPVLTLNKKVSSISSIVVKSGASDEAPQLAALSEGAVFDVVGELDNWYKVGIYGKYGWVEKDQVEDFTASSDINFLVENRKDFALAELSVESDSYAQRAFVNSRPIVEIINPSNNDEVYNRVSMELLAIDRTFGVSSVDIRVNGTAIEGSGARGLKISGTQNRNVRKSYSLRLRKGENEITVTAYNSKNVASDTQRINLYSQGVQNPPSLHVLAVGVSQYAKAGQNLAYAASDAEKIAAVFRSQQGADIYEEVKVKTLLNNAATRAGIKDGISTFLSDARADDMAVLFFAGHGITDSRGQYYLMGYDGDMKNPALHGLKQSDLEEDLIASIQAKKVLVMLDSCYSGGATGRRGADDITKVVEHLSKATGFAVMSAARGNEYAYENPVWGGGAFTIAVEEALKQRRGDSNKDGFVDINELDGYVYDKVVELTDSKQHPTSKRYSAESYMFYQVK